MKYNFKSSFTRCYKKLPPNEQAQVDKAIDNLMDFFNSKEKRKGLGVKHLRWDFWEIRSSLKIRILFTFHDDIISFIIVGNHNDIVKYLKNI